MIGARWPLLLAAAALAGCAAPGAIETSGEPDWLASLLVAPTPTGLAEPLLYAFDGHLDVSYYCLPAGAEPLEDAVYDRAAAEFRFDVPPGARTVNATLAWDAGTGNGAIEDLELEIYDSTDSYRGGSYADQPERVDVELKHDDAGEWLAWVYVCQSLPTDFVLEVEVR